MHKKKVCIHLLLYATKTTSQNHKGDMIKMFFGEKKASCSCIKTRSLTMTMLATCKLPVVYLEISSGTHTKHLFYFMDSCEL